MNSWDPSAQRARQTGIDTFKFYRDLFNRNSIDNKGLSLISVVHYSKRFGNAFWQPNSLRMVYGDGDGLVFGDMTSSKDVIGHELTHGVTQYTTGLYYEEQSGALNEHISDVFGAVFSQYMDNQKDPRQANWLIGPDIILQDYKDMLKENEPGHFCDALRSMKAPGKAFDCEELGGKDPQPEVMSQFVKLPNTDDGDYGGVHINSGIPNKAFYLFATSMPNKASWETAIQVWYKAITLGGQALPQDATFKKFAKATLIAAGQEDVSVQNALKKAWTDVQVLT